MVSLRVGKIPPILDSQREGKLFKPRHTSPQTTDDRWYLGPPRRITTNPDAGLEAPLLGRLDLPCCPCASHVREPRRTVKLRLVGESFEVVGEPTRQLCACECHDLGGGEEGHG